MPPAARHAQRPLARHVAVELDPAAVVVEARAEVERRAGLDREARRRRDAGRRTDLRDRRHPARDLQHRAVVELPAVGGRADAVREGERALVDVAHAFPEKRYRLEEELPRPILVRDLVGVVVARPVVIPHEGPALDVERAGRTEVEALATHPLDGPDVPRFPGGKDARHERELLRVVARLVRVGAARRQVVRDDRPVREAAQVVDAVQREQFLHRVALRRLGPPVRRVGHATARHRADPYVRAVWDDAAELAGGQRRSRRQRHAQKPTPRTHRSHSAHDRPSFL